jgi:MFS family permease
MATTLTSAIPDSRYTEYLIIVALVGWALASYDVNLLVVALPAIEHGLHISQTGAGILGFFYAAQFCITIFAGYGMDRFGRQAPRPVDHRPHESRIACWPFFTAYKLHTSASIFDGPPLLGYN